MYILPNCEIRGGAGRHRLAINPAFMEMYAAEGARGGVLEPAGIAEIKFRKAEVIKAMHRNDKQLRWMTMNAGRACAPGHLRARDAAHALLPAARRDLLRPARPPRAHARQGRHPPDRALGRRAHLFYWRLCRRCANERPARLPPPPSPVCPAPSRSRPPTPRHATPRHAATPPPAATPRRRHRNPAPPRKRALPPPTRRAAACRLREEELVAEMLKHGPALERESALAKINASLPEAVREDDQKAYELLAATSPSSTGRTP